MPKRPPYQDRWRDGCLVEKGRRECAERFTAIAEHVGAPRSVLDIGGWDGYFARRFADAGAAATLVEPRAVDDLPDGVTHMRGHVTGDTDLPAVEVALALSVLHHMDDWQAVYRLLRCSSDVLVVEVAHPDELAIPKLSPTLEATGHRIGPIHERVLADGEQIATTPGPNGADGERIRRPIVAVHNVLTGAVEAGSGVAAGIMADRPAGFWAPLGYQPEPGTLNLRVGRKGKSLVKRLPGPVALDDPTGGTAGPYWPVRIGDIDGHARTSRAQASIELVAPVNLREWLGLVDGDDVTVRPR